MGFNRKSFNHIYATETLSWYQIIVWDLEFLLSGILSSQNPTMKPILSTWLDCCFVLSNYAGRGFLFLNPIP